MDISRWTLDNLNNPDSHKIEDRTVIGISDEIFIIIQH